MSTFRRILDGFFFGLPRQANFVGCLINELNNLQHILRHEFDDYEVFNFFEDNIFKDCVRNRNVNKPENLKPKCKSCFYCHPEVQKFTTNTPDKSRILKNHFWSGLAAIAFWNYLFFNNGPAIPISFASYYFSITYEMIVCAVSWTFWVFVFREYFPLEIEYVTDSSIFDLSHLKMKEILLSVSSVGMLTLAVKFALFYWDMSPIRMPYIMSIFVPIWEYGLIKEKLSRIAFNILSHAYVCKMLSLMTSPKELKEVNSRRLNQVDDDSNAIKSGSSLKENFYAHLNGKRKLKEETRIDKYKLKTSKDSIVFPKYLNKIYDYFSTVEEFINLDENFDLIEKVLGEDANKFTSYFAELKNNNYLSKNNSESFNFYGNYPLFPCANNYTAIAF